MNRSNRDRPMLVYDGECPFCAAWIRHWRSLTGGSVEYAPFQTAAGSLPRIPLARFRESVQLVLPDGEVYSGARAVFATLAHARSGRWLWAYEHLPGFASLSEAVYRVIARRRTFLWKLCRFAAGAPANRSAGAGSSCCR